MHAQNGSEPQKLRLEWVTAGSLTNNPHNWRRHPERQERAVKAMIEDPEVGWAGACLFNERTGRLIDGHLRQKISKPDELVPVLIGSWSEAAEKKILLTLDPTSRLADTDEQSLLQLMADVKFDGDVLGSFGESLKSLYLSDAPTLADLAPATIEKQGRLDQKNPVVCPKCGHEFTP